jgi:hypothetical protein
MTQTAILSGSGLGSAPLENLGRKVAAWDNTIVSAYYYYDNGSINEAGGLYFYERSGDNWTDMTETFIQTASDGKDYDYLGYDIAMQGDTLLAGAWGNSDEGYRSGSVYAYTPSGINWSDGTSEQLILPKPRLGIDDARFGTSVAVDGTTAVIGIPDTRQEKEQPWCWNGMAAFGKKLLFLLRKNPKKEPDLEPP